MHCFIYFFVFDTKYYFSIKTSNSTRNGFNIELYSNELSEKGENY